MTGLGTSYIESGERTRSRPELVPQQSHRVDVACRILDVALAALLLVILAPLLVLIAIAIRLDSPGPAIFRQQRLGRGMEPFTVCKFRTMRDGVSEAVHEAFVAALIAGAQPDRQGHGPRFKLAADDRVTRVGHLLRRASLDELPQIFNVLHGEMSLVGPRPPIAYEVEKYPAPWFARFGVKPGITGLWQVNGRCELTHTQMIELDLEYIERRSLALNLWIMLRTVPAVLSGRGAS
jgi:lipopolysaccharide/colanic/teichoic acid biosynthesis glycosyltransferase